jgi:hypothetical protein
LLDEQEGNSIDVDLCGDSDHDAVHSSLKSKYQESLYDFLSLFKKFVSPKGPAHKKYKPPGASLGHGDSKAAYFREKWNQKQLSLAAEGCVYKLSHLYSNSSTTTNDTNSESSDEIEEDIEDEMFHAVETLLALQNVKIKLLILANNNNKILCRIDTIWRKR